MKYIREFDSLRAFSVIAVMIQHYFGQFKFLSALGGAGVTFFFVLSGYLITQILLKEKEFFKIEAGHNFRKSGYVLKTFYIRRSLRIFPIYYLILILLAIINMDSAREYFTYHALYLSNFLYSFKIDIDHLGHFWSLAVEEQFYLIWPFIILCLPFRFIKTGFFVALIIGSLAFKCWMINLYSLGNNAWNFLMPSCIESFSFGAIALLLVKQKVNTRNVPLLIIGSLLTFLILQLGIYKGNDPVIGMICYILTRTVFSLFACLVLVAVASGMQKGIVSLLLNSRFFVLIGKISYGIYIYHQFVPGLLSWLQSKSEINLQGTGVLMPLNFIITFIIAYLSFRFIEAPINSLKGKFEYK